MFPRLASICAVLAVSMAAAFPALAKDAPITIEQCPEPVQKVIREYQAKGQLQKIGRDEKKKSGGPPVYEARFKMADAGEIEVHIATTGAVLTIEHK